jgi:hypothetical protein
MAQKAGIKLDDLLEIQTSKGRVVPNSLIRAGIPPERFAEKSHEEKSPLRDRLGQTARQGDLVSGGYVPDRGDVVWLNFDPQSGRELASHRPRRSCEERGLEVAPREEERQGARARGTAGNRQTSGVAEPFLNADFRRLPATPLRH